MKTPLRKTPPAAAPPPPTALSIKDLTWEIHGMPLFRPVSLMLAGGQIALVRGDNGAGKSTLLRMIAGLLPSGGGYVHCTDDIITSSGNPDAHLLGHENGLKNHETVGQSLAFWGQIAAPFLSGGALLACEAVAARLNLRPLLNLPVSVLSAGQKRRLAFARLLLDRRPLWLLDEPTSSMDIKSSRIIETITRAYLEGGGMVIAATHHDFPGDGAGIVSRTIMLKRPPLQNPPPKPLTPQIPAAQTPTSSG